MGCSTCGGKKASPRPRPQPAKSYSPSRTMVSGGYSKPTVRMNFLKKKG